MIEAMSVFVLIGAGLVAVSIFTSLLSFRLGAPLLLVFLGVGLLAGEDGPGGIVFNDAETAFLLGSLALAVILFDSGFQTRIESVRAAGPPAVALATLGVLLTALFLAGGAHWLMGLGWAESLLLGAVVGSTDAAAVFFLLRVGGISIRDRVRSTLEVESGSNDPMAIFLTVAVLEVLRDGAAVGDLGLMFATGFVRQMGLGAVLGLAGGYAIVQVVNRVQLDSGLYPIVVMSLALCLFGAVVELGGSGFLAVYIAGIVAGNMRLRVAGQLRRFQSAMIWLFQIGMFLMLGLLATPSEFLDVAPSAVALALFLIFVARPAAVWLCLLPFGFTRHETAFVAYVGLRGAVSILLAIYPILAGLGFAQTLFDTAFIIVLVSLLVQGWAIRPLARWFDLVVPPRSGPVDRIELELPGAGSHELVVYRVVPGCPVALGERIPRWARPSLVVRGERSMALHKAGRLAEGDLAFIFIAPERIRLLDRLFASPVALEKGDRDFFGAFGFAPDTPIREIGRVYGLPVVAEDEDLSIAAVMAREFGGHLEVGDRMFYAGVEFIVREADGRGPVEIGLSVEGGRPPLPIFPNRLDIARLFRRVFGRRDRGAPRPATRSSDAAASTAAERDRSDGARRGCGDGPSG